VLRAMARRVRLIHEKSVKIRAAYSDLAAIFQPALRRRVRSS
jgi:hypothetical protein